MLRASLFKTAAWFDIFDYPLTEVELWQYLETPTSCREARHALNAPNLGLEEQNGFFYLPGRAETLAIRHKRHIVTDAKLKKARRRIRLFAWLPWVRLICLANNVGGRNLRGGGDIDIFMVTAPNRLWLTKAACTTLLKFSGLRPTRRKSANRICLSFLVDEQALDLSSFLLPDDPYLPYWLAGLIPLYGNWKVYERLLDANLWLKQRLPNWSGRGAPSLYFIAAKISNRPFRSFTFGRFLETAARVLHRRLMSGEIKRQANRRPGVVLTDTVMKLHTTDRREYFRQELATRLKHYAPRHS